MSEEFESMNSSPRSGRGGARPGAGRKQKRDKNGTAIEKAERQIRDRLPELIDRMFELASGVLVEGVDPQTAKTFIYQKPPEYKAISYLVDRIMGKPTERQEQTHEGGLTIRVVYADTDPEATETP